MSADVYVFETGAVRSTDADHVRYDLISPIALEEIAKTYHEGAAKYGDHNWLSGMPVADLLNHAIRHVYLYLSGDRSEPHLPHAAWGLMAAIHSEKMWPELNRNLLGPGCTPPSPPPGRQEADFDPDDPDQIDPGEIEQLADLVMGFDDFGDEAHDEDSSVETAAEAIAYLMTPNRIPRPVLYLSGPMTGIPDFNFPAFNAAADELRAKGYPVQNPADFGADPRHSWADCLARDLQIIPNVDMIVQLPGWESSRGASLEYSTAVALGKRVISYGAIRRLP